MATTSRFQASGRLSVRTATAVTLLLLGFVIIGFTSGVVVTVLRQSHSSQRIEGDPWRRTARGWENVRRWHPAPPPTRPHPLVVATWMLLGGIGSLYCCSGDKKES